EVRGYSVSLRPKRGAFRHADGTLALVDGGATTRILHEKELRVPGMHNVGNALAAAVVGDLYGVGAADIADVLRAFGGLAHPGGVRGGLGGLPPRREPVAEISGVLYVNDSQGTTPYATIPAIAAYDRPAVLILGGVSKGADYTDLAREVVRRARGAVLIGRSADEIFTALERAGAAKKLPVER